MECCLQMVEKCVLKPQREGGGMKTGKNEQHQVIDGSVDKPSGNWQFIPKQIQFTNFLDNLVKTLVDFHLEIDEILRKIIICKP